MSQITCYAGGRAQFSQLDAAFNELWEGIMSGGLSSGNLFNNTCQRYLTGLPRVVL